LDLNEARFCLRCGAALAPFVDAGLERRRCTAPGCGWTHYDNPLPVVAAIVEHEGDVVLVRAKGWPETWFGLVTGFLERGEEPAEAVLREVKEELGLEATIVSFVGVYAFPQRNEVIAAWHVRATGEISLGDELAAFKRVPKAKLRPWPFGTGAAVRDWLASG
jgi:NADH pyrophosphatase NudC (nudix superfamily)